MKNGKREDTHKVRRPLPPLRHLRNTQRQHRAPHRLPILILIQLSVQIQLKVHQLRRAQRHDDLPRVRRGRDDRLALRYSPLVHAAVREDVSDAVWVYLEERVGADLLHGEGGRGGEETGILDFFDRLADAEDQGTVHERQDDIRIESICWGGGGENLIDDSN